MKTYFLLLLISISMSGSLYSQKFKKPINYRFKGGEIGYISFFSKSIHFPETAIQNALPLLNELIKRDPFNRDLYKVRIMINIRLNRPEFVNQDDNKIFDFAEGFSLDELNRDQ